MWGWRVEQTLPLHFENVIEELWVGAVGSSGAFKGFQGGCKQYGGSIRWTLLALSTDPDEYTIPLEVSRPCRGRETDTDADTDTDIDIDAGTEGGHATFSLFYSHHRELSLVSLGHCAR